MGKQSYTTKVEDRTQVLNCKIWDIDEDNSVAIYDLGGHESYRQLVHLFHKNSPNNVIIITHDITKVAELDLSSTCQWLSELVIMSPKSQFLLLLTKIDLVSNEQQFSRVTTFINFVENHISAKLKDLNDHLSSNSDEHVQNCVHTYDKLLANITDFTIPLSCKTDNTLVELTYKIKELFLNEHMYTSLDQTSQLIYHAIGVLGKLEEEEILYPKEQLEKSVEQLKSVSGELKPNNVAEATDIPIKSLTWIKLNELDNILEPFIRDGRLSFKINKTNKEIALKNIHTNGLIIWYDGNEKLKQYIFNDIACFSDMMKSFFNHDKEAFTYDKLSSDVKIYLQREHVWEEDYESDLRRMYQEGVLSVILMKSMLRKYHFEEHYEFVIELLKLLNIAYPLQSTQTVAWSTIQCRYLFFPWYVDREEPSDEIQHRLHDLVTPDKSLLNHIKLSGHITTSLFHNFCCKLLSFITDYNNSPAIQLWKSSLLLHINNVDVYLVLKRNPSGRDVIQVVMKSTLDSISSLQDLWGLIKNVKENVVDLRLNWWPGCILSTFISCAHCLMSGGKLNLQQIQAVQWPLSGQLEKISKPGNTMKCDVKMKSSFPESLVMPLPKGTSYSVFTCIDVSKYRYISWLCFRIPIT